jgi:hypothetical protein
MLSVDSIEPGPGSGKGHEGKIQTAASGRLPGADRRSGGTLLRCRPNIGEDERRPVGRHRRRLPRLHPRLAVFMREWIFALIDGCHWMKSFEAPPMAGLSLDSIHGTLGAA